ncbi:MAG TPA: ABC transporter permease subunit [Thermoanaerobaculia bacterium]|nr:ABC transporter permease subunit [Thermoanaerobaculia bacterium]HUM30671.1 ABC transporter permease subunit [Thermoanaerobaculia bacterium]HXK68921.1 ABC transporter permease subunit [Thermoanaerobaculia bacterium]
MGSISKKRIFRNLTAHGVFTVGGISVILIILLMLGFLFKEVFPLFEQAKVEKTWTVPGNDDDPAVHCLISEDGSLLLVLFQSGLVTLTDSKSGDLRSEWSLPGPVETVAYHDHGLAYTSANRLYGLSFTFSRDPDSGMESGGDVRILTSLDLPMESVSTVAISSLSSDTYTLAVSSGRQVQILNRKVKQSLFGSGEVVEDHASIDLPEPVVGMLFYPDDTLIVGTVSGMLGQYELTGSPRSAFQGPNPLTVMGQLIGGRGICLGGSDGSIQVWSQASTDEGRKFIKIHDLPSMKASIAGFSFSNRDRSFVAWDSKGNLGLYYSTTEQRKLLMEGTPGNQYTLNPKGNLIAGYLNPRIFYSIENPHPEVSLKTLFGKVWYEGYDSPQYVWQSTGGSNDFESKFSLIPLILGTLKGTLYAMIFALPLALTGALFMNQFLHPDMHRYIKPVVEIMAGLPSVIIGFLAGLWLAPLLEQILPGVLLGLLVVPLATVSFTLLADRWIFRTGQDTFKWEILTLIPVMVVIFWICVKASPMIDHLLFQGDFRQYIFETLHTPYDQRNAIVVGFAMGFAVIPIIFSLAEDAFSFVPREIVAGSLALGLSRYQTATGVVLKAARSGVFSAAMIGLGRAVGETMIVLMATGNTPVLSMSPFNGFRTFSANIAVELPEAPVGGSPYRILFLTALLLLLFTLVINSVADLIRQSMKKRMGQ